MFKMLIFYMNDIVNAADDNNIILYADDISHGRNLSNFINQTREHLRKIQSGLYVIDWRFIITFYVKNIQHLSQSVIILR